MKKSLRTKKGTAIRVLHILGDSRFGGGSILVARMAQRAQECGWQVDVLTTDTQFQVFLRNAGVGTVDLDCIWRNTRPWRDVSGLLRLVRFLRSGKYDVVHTHTSKAGFIGRLASRLARTPVILHTVHGFAFHEGSNPWVIRAYSTLERVAAAWCDRVVTVSHFHREWALRLGIGSKDSVVAIPNGIDPARTRPSCSAPVARERLGICSDEIAVVSLTRLASEKGLEYLLDATRILAGRADLPPFRVFLAGDGPLRSELEQLVSQLRLSDRVVFLGFRSDVGDLLQAADVVVLPTEREGLSISLLEAMSAAKTILTTTIGSNYEVVQHEDGALLVPPRDAEQLANALGALLRDQNLRTRLGKRALAVFLARYTEDQMLNAYMTLYKELMVAKGRGA